MEEQEVPQPEVQQEQQVEQPHQQPLDIDAAYQMLAQQHGITPEAARDAFVVRGESERVYHEYRRKLTDLERQQQTASQARRPAYGNGNEQEYDEPMPRWAREQRDMMQSFLEREAEKERKAQEEQQFQQDLNMGFRGLNARLGKAYDQDKVVDALMRLYPSQDVLRAVGVPHALDMAYEYMSRGGNGFNNQPTRPPRATSITVPVGTSGGAGPPSDDLTPHRLPNETVEQFQERAKRIMANAPRLGPGTYRSD